MSRSAVDLPQPEGPSSVRNFASGGWSGNPEGGDAIGEALADPAQRDQRLRHCRDARRHSDPADREGRSSSPNLFVHEARRIALGEGEIGREDAGLGHFVEETAHTRVRHRAYAEGDRIAEIDDAALLQLFDRIGELALRQLQIILADRGVGGGIVRVVNDTSR